MFYVTYLQQNFGRICKVSVLGVDSLNVQQFHDVTGNLEMVLPISDMSPTSETSTQSKYIYSTETEMCSHLQTHSSEILIVSNPREGQDTYLFS